MSRQMLMVAVMTASLVIPASMAQAGEPLATGTYVLNLEDAGRLVLTIDQQGTPHVDAPVGVQVLLERDADNRVLDEFEVVTSGGSLAVDLDVELDGSYEVDTKKMDAAGQIITDALPAGLAKAEAAGGKAMAMGVRARAAATLAAANDVDVEDEESAVVPVSTSKVEKRTTKTATKAQTQPQKAAAQADRNEAKANKQADKNEAKADEQAEDDQVSDDAEDTSDSPQDLKDEDQQDLKDEDQQDNRAAPAEGKGNGLAKAKGKKN